MTGLLIGTFGPKIVFTVSSFEVLTFTGLSMTTKGRWTVHEVLNGKPRPEFLGPDLRSVKFTIQLNYELGVYPKVVLKSLHDMAEKGECEYLIIGGMPIADNPMRLVSMSEAWDTVYGNGFLAECKVDLELEEYR